MSRWIAAAFVALMILGAALRAPHLAERPLHNDEGVNAIKFRDLYVTHDYKYDPNEFHGPTLPYFTLAAAWLNGAGDYNGFTESFFRAVPVVFGVGLIGLVALLGAALGWGRTLWAALFTALSPAFVFYSRDYIHETLLTFFAALTFIAAWRYAQTRRWAWAVVGGLALGLMAATKETFVFALAAMAAAVFCSRLRRKPESPTLWPGAVAALGIAAVVAGLLFTSFFANPAGLADAARAYLPWLHRAGGATPHTHPWYFYLARLKFEALLGLLAIVGLAAARSPLEKIIGYYTLFLTAIYAVLPYKTPWCLLGFWHGAILLAGIGAGAIWERKSWRWLAAPVLGAISLQLAGSAWWVNFGQAHGAPESSAPSNPYVYAQTSPDIIRLVDTINGIAQASPEKFGAVLEVVSPESYWPLPWYLRRFERVGFWEQMPDQPLAPIMVVAANLGAALDERPGRTHLMAGYFKLRPDVFMELYVRIDLWTRYVQAGSRPAE
ncbi:MAG TPA: flippase activity-associated protein Agl23 [Verrucomicrobiae bacterium]|jgi:uncharacterized protein (TIGR03663 family)|nr:flippase activity-associated protein Agl23 [Verrucomicrobiae bacterium]